MAAEPSRSAVDELLLDLERRILTRELYPGEPLREVELAARYGAGRNTVALALRELTWLGLVRHHRNRGASVARITRSDLRDLYALREILEVGAIERIAELRPDLGPLREAVAALELAEASQFVHTDNGDVWIALPGLAGASARDLAVHEALIDAAGIDRLRRAYRGLATELRLSYVIAEVGGMLPDRDHRRILESLEHGDRAAATTILRNHLAEALEFCLQRLPQ